MSSCIIYLHIGIVWMNIKAKTGSESRNKGITFLSSVPRLFGHIYSLQLHQVYKCKWKENIATAKSTGVSFSQFHNGITQLYSDTWSQGNMSLEPSFKPLPSTSFRPRTEICNRKLKQPRRVCIFDNEKQEFCTLCTCIFHYWKFRRRSRSFHNVKWPVLQLRGRRTLVTKNVQFLIENDHLRDSSAEKACCWPTVVVK